LPTPFLDEFFEADAEPAVPPVSSVEEAVQADWHRRVHDARVRTMHAIRQRQRAALHSRLRFAILEELDIQEALLELHRDRLQHPQITLSQHDLDVLRRRPQALALARQQFPGLFDDDARCDSDDLE